MTCLSVIYGSLHLSIWIPVTIWSHLLNSVHLCFHSIPFVLLLEYICTHIYRLHFHILHAHYTTQFLNQLREEKKYASILSFKVISTFFFFFLIDLNYCLEMLACLLAFSLNNFLSFSFILFLSTPRTRKSQISYLHHHFSILSSTSSNLPAFSEISSFVVIFSSRISIWFLFMISISLLVCSI